MAWWSKWSALSESDFAEANASRLFETTSRAR
jgi:hypothetical protein